MVLCSIENSKTQIDLGSVMENELYPRIEINLDSIEFNTKKVVALCNQNDIEVIAVTKLVCGHPSVAKIFVDAGVKMLADARLTNILKYKNIDEPKLMLRLPMCSQVDLVVEHCTTSLVSEYEMMRLLSEAALMKHTSHEVIVMIDMGDLREGIYSEDEIQKTFKNAVNLEGIRITGIGVNLSCYGGVMPTQDLLSKLVAFKNQLNKDYELDMSIVSGGNSGTLSLLVNEGKLPKGVNQLRLGASLLLGIGLNDDPIEGLKQDAFQLVSEVIEVREKPSVPVGKIGLDAFGNQPVFEDKGTITRCICAIGRQDVNPDDLIPLDESIEILGASSDHLIIDVSRSKMNYAIGDKIRFNLTYGGCLSLMTSEYVHKHIVEKAENQSN